jgi:FkbM family methyltransferase
MYQNALVSYAQNGEDALLRRALSDVQRGFYIDVGAQDPIEFSVTKAFYERGWHGINIEPVRHWHDRLVEDRPHDINLRLAASNQVGTIKLFEVEDTGLSTSAPEFARRHETEGYTLREQTVECTTLDQICADNDVHTVHFLKIDCEGAEKSALGGISLAGVRPWIILVEATEPNSTKPTWHEWEYLLTGRGYHFVFFDGLNRYYLADEHMNRASAFEAPVNVFDSVTRISEVNAQKRIEQLQGEVEGLRGAVIVAKLRARLGAAKAERDAAIVERDAVTAERDAAVAAHHAALQHEEAEHKRELGRLQASLAELLSSHSWRITAPLRACSRATRRLYRGVRRLVYLLLRPFAHWAKPVLLRLAQKPAARKLVIRVFGRHSRLVNTARLFLIGTPTPYHPAEAMAPSPEVVKEGESLSARGREVLSTIEDMRMQEKGETQRASRT